LRAAYSPSEVGLVAGHVYLLVSCRPLSNGFQLP
jgi:hypothetical protein